MDYFYSFVADFFPLILYSLWGFFLFIFYVVKKETNRRFVKLSLLIFLLMTVLVIASQALDLFLHYRQTPYLHYLLTQTDYYWLKITRLIVSQVVSVFFAFIFSLVIFFLAQKTQQEIIDALDVFLLSFSLLVLGWPNFLLFLILLLLMVVVGGLIQVVTKKSNWQGRFILTPYILPAFLLILWFGNFLARLTGLDKIRF